MNKLFCWETSPLKDWIWQRVSACVFLVYAIAVLVYLYISPDVTFTAWRDFILSPAMRILGSLALLSLVIHAWIGLWTVITDYVKGDAISKASIMAVIVILIGYLGAGMFLLWGM